MKSIILHVESGTELDLAASYWDDQTRQLIDAAYGHCHEKPPTLTCGIHSWAPLYLQRRHGDMHAIHFDGSLGQHRLPSHGPSPEHERQIEYVIRAGEHAGHRAGISVPTVGRLTIVDAVLYGPAANIGAEIQRSSLSIAAARQRTAKTVKAQITPYWFTDWERLPAWFHRVPSVGMALRGTWNVLPPARSATVGSGVRRITAVKCTIGNVHHWGGACWDGKRRPCGEWHPIHEPWTGLTVDDVAAWAPAGELVTMSFKAKRRRDTLITDPASVNLYRELTGLPPEVMFQAAAREVGKLHSPERWECAAAIARPPLWPPGAIFNQLALDLATGEQGLLAEAAAAREPYVRPGLCTLCSQPANLYRQGWRCIGHKPLPIDWSAP